ncbi:putative T7SS-secreted protein [Streptomyces sp. WAC 06738]|uniref:putative T7SS-secreted protein n=1 Tax=Streptomyces sp. WAC 06738 TaxID=2203210 RepID=UPI001F0CD7EB|nr:hypothetical protein [Streptomyces sp. WAC 06738]
MSAPTAADYPTLGFVPCPGDYETAKDTAATVRRTSDALGEICRVLEGAGEGDWRGKAADAFRALLADDFRPKVQDAYSAFSTARTVLTDWAENIDRRQRAAARLEDEAAELKRAADAEAAREEEKDEEGEGARGLRARGRDRGRGPGGPSRRRIPSPTYAAGRAASRTTTSRRAATPPTGCSGPSTSPPTSPASGTSWATRSPGRWRPSARP